MVKAGYNPLGLITYIHKTVPQARQDKISSNNLTSKRLANIYEKIYMQYPSFLVNNTYIKQMALTNTQKEDKQIILYEDRLEFGTGYTRAIYYYSDIVLCSESSGVITIITDTAAMPLSIQKSCVSKGSYDEFSFILRKNMGGKYQYMGGKV